MEKVVESSLNYMRRCLFITILRKIIYLSDLRKIVAHQKVFHGEVGKGLGESGSYYIHTYYFVAAVTTVSLTSIRNTVQYTTSFIKIHVHAEFLEDNCDKFT